MKSSITGFALLLMASTATAGAEFISAASEPGALQETPTANAAPDARTIALDELRELAELDLVGELIPKGRAWTSSGGLLQTSGEARALVARALHAAGEETEATDLLAGANLPADKRLPANEQVWVDLEQVRFFLALDQLESALDKLTLPPDPAKPSASRELRHPEIEIAWLLLARTYARAGDLRHAAPAAQEFLKRAALHPEAPSAWHLLATAAIEVRDAERAERFLVRARESEQWHGIFSARRMQLRRTPNDPLPRLGLGMAWMQVKAFDRAQAEFDQLVSEHPTYSRGWFHLGEAHRLQDDLSSAYTAYSRALDTDSSQHLARYNLAIIDLMQARPEKAQVSLELLMSTPEIESDLRFVEAHQHLAKIYEALGDKSRAAEQMARYRELTKTSK